uniref:Uncharacterized protein n=1 Tax=Salix viminalis TaxID=40686 RepID=A0A6N2KVL8_SALVM
MAPSPMSTPYSREKYLLDMQGLKNHVHQICFSQEYFVKMAIKTVAEEEFLNQQTKTVAEGASGFSKSDSSSARKGDVFGVNWRKKKRKRRRRLRDKLEDRLRMAKRQGRLFEAEWTEG